MYYRVGDKSKKLTFDERMQLMYGKGDMLYENTYIKTAFPCARIRFLKYEGTEEKTGAQMNIIKDIMFEGPILHMLQKALDFVQTQIKEYTKLHKDARFHTIPEYPEFVWKEAIINAVAHRDYHILGTDMDIGK